MVEGLVQGTHDSEAGGSGGSRSARRAREAQPQEQQPVDDVGTFLNDDSNSEHEQANVEPVRVRAPRRRKAPVEEEVVEEEEEEGEGYGGGPRDMSLLYEYHKHRAIPIWRVRNHEHPVYNFTPITFTKL